MNKQQYEEWVIRADEALQQDTRLFKDEACQEIYKSYNGYVAALGVSVLMIGLVPTLSIYYQDKEGVCRRNILEVISNMIGLGTARQLLENALNSTTSRSELQKMVIESSIALKQVVRTYKLVD